MRIAIVNDVTLAIEAMRRVILGSGAHEIAWTAMDGAEALDRCCRDTPDLILMDLIMPKTDGVEATRRIMACCPCAILVVTANVTDNCSKVFEAMGAGALDAVNTPVLEWPGSCKGAADLLGKIETIRKLIGVPPALRGASHPTDSSPAAGHLEGRLIVIGASAGGPAALSRILGYLPANLRAFRTGPCKLVGRSDPLAGEACPGRRLPCTGNHPAGGPRPAPDRHQAAQAGIYTGAERLLLSAIGGRFFQ